MANPHHLLVAHRPVCAPQETAAPVGRGGRLANRSAGSQPAVQDAERKSARVGATLLAVIGAFFIAIVIGLILLFAL
jgi:hypothetical protein